MLDCHQNHRARIRGGTPLLVVIVLGLSILLVLIGLILNFSPALKGRPKLDAPGQTEKTPTPISAEIPSFKTDDFIRDLTDSGWTRSSAVAVVELNASWFQRLAHEAPEDLERQRIAMKRLGRVPQVFDVLEHHPEAAGLLASADDPVLVADSLRDDRHYDILSSLYVRYVAPEDSAALARAWTRHGDSIARLSDRGLPGVELLFLGDEESPGAREYGRWLDDYCREQLVRSDEELAAAIGLVLVHGVDLRRRLEDDVEFRRNFRETLWPRYLRVASEAHLGLETFVWSPEIWDLLRLPEAEELIRRWGLLPLDLLYSSQGAYPEDLHPELIQLMLRGDNTTIRALYDFRNEPLLYRILRRPGLSDSTRLAFLDRLLSEGSEVLKRFDQLSDRAFREELGPPASGPVTWLPLYYTFYEVPKKILQGRPIPAIELFQAGADPILIWCLPGAKLPGKLPGPIKTTLVGQARQLATKQLGIQAEKMGEKELAPWLLTTVLTQIQQKIRTELARRSTVEITQPVRFLYETSGLGRASFRRLTDLEARLFMRADARVFVRLDRAFARSVSGRFLGETAQAGGINAAIESPVGQTTIQGLATAGAEGGTKTVEGSRTWQKNVSAWWLMNAIGKKP